MNEVKDNYETASKGLDKLFIAQILGCAAVLMTLSPTIGILSVFVNLAGSIVLLLAIIQLACSYCGYRYAMYAVGMTVLCNLVSMLGIQRGLMVMAKVLLNALVAYSVCTVTAKLLREKGHHTLSKLGILVGILNVVHAAGQIAIVVTAERLLAIENAALYVQYALIIGLIVMAILYLIYLYKAPKALLSERREPCQARDGQPEA